MRIYGFMHGVNNPELTKRLNEHVPKTMKEIMIATTAFIRGETDTAGKKKGHAPWKAQDQSKRHASERRSNFRNQSRKGRGSSWFTPLTRTPKEILAIEAGKFKPPPPMVTPVEKRSSNKFCDFHNDKGHSTDESLFQPTPTGNQEPDGPGDDIAHWFQRRNYIVAGTTLTPGNNRRCISFYEGMDELHDPEHRLNIREGYSPVRQKKRGQALEQAKAIQTEVQKLVEAGIIREVYYHEWLSNPIMVKKHDGSWRMCVDFTYLNKACPQDCYPLPEINWKIESLCGYPFKCFLDTYKGYHRIQMAELDEEKTAFYAGQGAFDSQVGRNMEVYVDELVIKSHTETEMLRDIGETFRTLRKINMKLNPKKCTLGAAEGMFLGYMVLPEGIKPCLSKTEAVLQLSSPRIIKETPEAEHAFKQLKQHLSELPLLVAPKPKEELIVYLSASHGAISAVLMTERDTVQTPVYFVSHALQEKPDESPPDIPMVEILQEPWTLFMDGSSCVDRSGAGLILTSPEGTEFTYVLRFQFTASNNEAEYEALIADLRISAQMGVRNVHVSVDSKLVANQVLGTYVAKEENMIKYLEKAKSLISGFAKFSISQVPRSKNKKADALSKIASTSFAHLSKQVLVEILQEKSIQEKEVATVVEEEGPTWMTPIIEYLKEGTLLGERKEESKLQAVIPAEIGMPTYRTAVVDTVHNDKELRLNLDLLEEKRERATICEAKAKLKMTKHYNARVRGVTFRPGDFVYSSNDASHDVTGGKLSPK
ncbi:reverse transcriptase domain-containing protein [Tanacetum coccineum]